MSHFLTGGAGWRFLHHLPYVHAQPTTHISYFKTREHTRYGDHINAITWRVGNLKIHRPDRIDKTWHVAGIA
jgi:hypothetical protein